MAHVRSILPPGSTTCSAAETRERFTLLADNTGTYGLAKSGKGIARGLELALALEILDSQLRIHIGEHSPEGIFVHAGVVGHLGRALVIPGVSFAGKTTLVRELVRAGAIYYSDEFAVIDVEGRIHPYAKPLSIREDGGYVQVDHDVGMLRRHDRRRSNPARDRRRHSLPSRFGLEPEAALCRRGRAGDVRAHRSGAVAPPRSHAGAGPCRRAGDRHRERPRRGAGNRAESALASSSVPRSGRSAPTPGCQKPHESVQELAMCSFTERSAPATFSPRVRTTLM